MKKSINRVIAVFMTVVILLSVAIPLSLTASAATTGTVYMLVLPMPHDKNQNGWGHPTLNFKNGWRSPASDTVTVKAIGGYDNQTVYCLEPGVSLRTGNALEQKDENYWDNYPDNLNDILNSDTVKVYL